MSKNTHTAELSTIADLGRDIDADGESVDIDHSGDTDTDTTKDADPSHDHAPARNQRWKRTFAYGMLGVAIVTAAVGFGYLKWQSTLESKTQTARAESVRTAIDDAIAILSYRPESAEQELNAAIDLLTGDFRDEYTKLINEVVIPGAQQNRVSAVVDIPAAASISATPDRAEVLVFVNQTTLFGDTPPSTTSSSVRITLERVGDRWLMSQFDPV